MTNETTVNPQVIFLCSLEDNSYWKYTGDLQEKQNRLNDAMKRSTSRLQVLQILQFPTPSFQPW